MSPIVQLLLIGSLLGPLLSDAQRQYDPPVIGILCQEYYKSVGIQPAFPGHKAYIAASYVKAVEASGGMVVPVLIGQSHGYYEKIVSQINGLVIPGGAAWFNSTDGYKDAGNTIFHIAEKINLRGDSFPILGICLGFELLLFVNNGEKELRTKCNVFNEELRLRFLKGRSKFGLYKNFPKKYLRALSEENITYNYHIWCITRASLSRTNLRDSWDIISESVGKSNNWFVSTVQHKKFPFVGIQFHPEKSAYEWNIKGKINHSRTAIETSRLFYDWLVTEASKNNHSYSSREALYKDVIYNFSPVMSFPHNNETSFEQLYFFD